jgi:hypothetical protein
MAASLQEYEQAYRLHAASVHTSAAVPPSLSQRQPAAVVAAAAAQQLVAEP